MNRERDVKKLYGGTLVELMKQDENIYGVDTDLMFIAGAENVPENFPQRHVNVGIAEQNALSLSAGIASMGKTVFVSAFCGFLATRGSDQCLNTVCYNNMNVKLVGTYAGITSGVNGGTHISISDIASFRSMPGMKILEVSDPIEMQWALSEAARIPGPVYVRVPKGTVDEIFDENVHFELGKGIVMCEAQPENSSGLRIALITSGIVTPEGIKATALLKEKGIGITHIHMTSIKPIDKELVISTAENHDLIVTAENHSVIGGLGAAVCEIVCEAAPTKVVRLGMQDEFCEGMTKQELADRHGISAKAIAQKIEELQSLSKA